MPPLQMLLGLQSHVAFFVDLEYINARRMLLKIDLCTQLGEILSLNCPVIPAHGLFLKAE